MIGTPHYDEGAARRKHVAAYLHDLLDCWMPGTLEAAIAPPTQQDTDLRDALQTVWRVDLNEDFEAQRRRKA